MNATPSQFGPESRFTEEDTGEDRDQHHAQLVDRSHLSCIANPEGTEVAKPGRAGGAA